MTRGAGTTRTDETQGQGRSIATTLVIALAVGVALATPKRAAAYTFQKSITVDRTKINVASCGTTLSNYPLLFKVTDPDLKHTSTLPPGDVTDLDGDDIIFKALDPTTCGGPPSCVLDHEIEKYVRTTGELVAWVRIPSVNTNAAASNTVIYVYYGDSSVTSPTENPNGVWDANFKGVYHLEEDVVDEASGATHDDSTSNANDGTQNGNVEATGKIADGQRFDGPDGTDDRIVLAAAPAVTSAITVSAWVQHSDVAARAREDYIDLGNEVSIRYDGPNGLGQLDFYVRNAATSYHLRANGVLTTGPWYYVVGTYDGTDQRLFLNGTQLLSTTLSLPLDPITGTSAISTPGLEPMNGIIDEVRVSNTARTACWIDAEYDNQNAPASFYTVGAETAATCAPTVTGASYVGAGQTFTLKLNAGCAPLSGSWVVNWGDGRIQTLPGTPTTATHTYAAVSYTPSYFTYDITASMKDAGGNTYFGGHIAVPSGGTDGLVFYGHNATANAGRGQAASASAQTTWNYPVGTVVGPDYRVYVGSWQGDGRIDVFFSNGTKEKTLTPVGRNCGTATRCSAAGMAFGRDGFLYVAYYDSDEVLRFNPVTGASSVFVTSAVYPGNGPSGMEFGPDGHLYVADYLGDTVYRFNGSTGASMGVFISGTVPNDPEDITFGPDCNNPDVDGELSLYVASEIGDSVNCYQGPYSGTPGAFVKVFVSPNTAILQDTQGVAFGPDGNFYASGWTSNNVRRYNGTTGVSIDDYVAAGTLNNAEYFSFRAGHQVKVISAVATAVELLSFEARGRDGAVEVLWETGSEVDNLGFHLYRSLSESGPWERITTSLMPGLGSSPEGARYGYSDVGLVNGVTYFYQLEDVETTGKTKRHGPVSATPQAGAVTPPAEDSAASEAGEDPSAEASAWIRYGDPEATSLSVLERGERQVVVELRTGGFWAFPDEDGGVWLQIPGFDETRQPGAPALPVRQAWLEALAGRKVKLGSVVGHDVVAFDGLRPAVTGAPELWEAEDGTLQAGQRRARAGRAFQAAGLFPEAAAELVGVAFQGDVKKAQLALSPLRWDRSAGRLLLARRLVVRVEFAGIEQDELALGGSHGRKQRGKPQRVSAGVVARLAVEAPGLYGVSYEELFGGGGRGVSVSELSLSRQGEAVAFHVEPAGRRFGPGGRLYFASAGSKLNPYGKQAVYELALGSGGVPMPLVSAAPGAWGIPYYWQQLEQEKNLLFNPSLLDAPDLWLWQYVLSGRTNGYPFSLSALAPASEAGRLTVWLQGASDFPVDPDHHVRLSVNGQQVGEASWDGKRAQQIEAALWPGLLREGDNLLEIRNVGDTGASSSLVILDRFAVSYPRRLVAQAGVLAGRFPSSGSAEVQGVGAASYVLDMSAPVPRWLSGMTATALGVSFAAEAGHEYQVVSPEALLRPQVRAAAPDTLRDVTRRGEYLVVGPRGFLEAAEPLLAQRASQGLETLAVAIEDVYDTFGFGETRPEALRDFLAYAYHNWQLAPRYVLLLGDASYDFKDYYGIGNAVPPYMIPDAYMWTVSDPAYASVNGDDLLPDLALGRLSAQSLEQARALVQKLLAWENAGYDLSQRAVLVADNSDAGGDFEGDAERVAQSLLGGREVERIYLSRLGGATRVAIYDAFARGASLMSYLGHGATTVWASENVLNSWDVPKLAPQPQQPFLLTMNCLNGYFHMPSQGSSLAEALVKEPERGAIGAIAASSLSIHWAASLYHDALVAELASGRHLRLGDAILAAQSTYASSGAPIELLAIYQTLADPALKIR